MLFLYNLLGYLGYFLVMIIFMIVAIVAAKNAFGWVCYVVGAVLQLISLLGNITASVDMTLHWIIYFGLLFVTAVIAVKRSDSKKATEEDTSEMPKQLHTCDMCKHSFNKVTYVKMADDTDVDSRNLCDACMKIYLAEIERKSETKTEEPTGNKIQFCRKCGNKLLDDAIFCNKCGTKIAQIEKGGE